MLSKPLVLLSSALLPASKLNTLSPASYTFFAKTAYRKYV